MRVVVDTNVLVRAHKHAAGPAREVLTLIRAEPHVLLTSMPLLIELARVLLYPRVRALHKLTVEEIEEFLEDIVWLSDVVLPGHVSTVAQDPDDDMVIQTAVAGQANVICTLDRHLRRDAKVQRYCGRHGIRIMDDVQLLDLLRASKDK